MTWNTIDSAPVGIEVMTKIDDEGGVRNEQSGIKRGNMWYGTKPDSMYWYYVPTHWKHKE